MRPMTAIIASRAIEIGAYALMIGVVLAGFLSCIYIVPPRSLGSLSAGFTIATLSMWLLDIPRSIDGSPKPISRGTRRLFALLIVVWLGIAITTGFREGWFIAVVAALAGGGVATLLIIFRTGVFSALRAARRLRGENVGSHPARSKLRSPYDRSRSHRCQRPLWVESGRWLGARNWTFARVALLGLGARTRTTGAALPLGAVGTAGRRCSPCGGRRTEFRKVYVLRTHPEKACTGP
jgi:hypothetical protein